MGISLPPAHNSDCSSEAEKEEFGNQRKFFRRKFATNFNAKNILSRITNSWGELVNKEEFAKKDSKVDSRMPKSYLIIVIIVIIWLSWLSWLGRIYVYY